MQDRKIFTTPKTALIFVYGEIFLVFLIVVQLYKILGIEISVGKVSVFASAPMMQNFLWFGGTILFLIILYVGIAIRDPRVKKMHRDFSKIVLGTGKQKFFGMDREILTLLVTEFVFAIILAIAIYIYLDPETNIIPWPMNYIAFFVFLIIGLYFFSQTKPFREVVYGESRLKKISPAKRLFPTRRITNNKTGTIRITPKKKRKHVSRVKKR